MVRKRNTSPTPSASGRRYSGSSANLPARTTPSTPAKQAAPAAAPESKSSSGGGRKTGDVMKDMAATAAGVAAGSAVGHAVGAGITSLFSGGGGGGSRQVESAPPAAPPARHEPQLLAEGPCAFEIKQFLKCSQENGDLSACEGFNEALRECRKRYNLQ